MNVDYWTKLNIMKKRKKIKYYGINLYDTVIMCETWGVEVWR